MAIRGKSKQATPAQPQTRSRSGPVQYSSPWYWRAFVVFFVSLIIIISSYFRGDLPTYVVSGCVLIILWTVYGLR